MDQDSVSEAVIFESQCVSLEAARFHHGLIRRRRGLGTLTREATLLVDLLLGHGMRQRGSQGITRGLNHPLAEPAFGRWRRLNGRRLVCDSDYQGEESFAETEGRHGSANNPSNK